MNNIVLLANSDDMRDVAEAAIQHTGADIQIAVTHTYEESCRLAVEYEKQGCAMIIARGGHARAIRSSNIAIPVTMIPFTGNNIASRLAEAKKDWGEFAVLGNPTMIQMVRELERPIGAKVHYFEVVRWGDISSLVDRIRELGIKAVVGGYDACAAARARGIHDYCIKTSEFEIVTAIMDAKSVMVSLERDRYWDNLFRATLDSMSDGVMVVAADGSITHANRRAQKLLSRDSDLSSIRGEEMKKLLRQAVESGMPSYDEIIDFDDSKLSVSCLPLDNSKSNIVFILQEIEYVHKIERKIRQKLTSKGLVAKNSFENIKAASPALKEAVRIAKTYAEVESTVLISGETGTGKEMFAQSIHNYSRRANEAFVAVNCATIPANLLESELFGYAEGAFTGAKKGGKIGLFEMAHKGTIFLDEIGETSLDMQARLLRVLEEHEIMRVGDDKVIPVDIRVIAASNRDLRAMVDEGKFRADFYYRLDVLALHLPSLRQCTDSIIPMMEYYIERYARRNNRRTPELSPESCEILEKYRWPGNIRELKNVAERLAVTNNDPELSAEKVLEALHLHEAPHTLQERPAPKPRRAHSGVLSEAEAEAIKKALKDCEGNKTAAAKLLGVSRPTLNKKLKEIYGNSES